MASVVRQPFAPLDGTRLQGFASIKNRQNAITSPAKRKASNDIDLDDLENINPLLFAKRSKKSISSSPNDLLKPSTPYYHLTHKPTHTPTHTPPTPSSSFFQSKSTLNSIPAPPAAPPAIAIALASRPILTPRSPTSRLLASLSKPPTTVAKPALSSSSAPKHPAGRSPPRNRRSGILSRRRVTPYSRVDPPAFALGAANNASPFSLDAALKGTIPSYKSRQSIASPTRAPASIFDSASPSLDGQDTKASWFFDIHEDTPEQEMTNLLQHSTCVLDISSDEESERKATREKAEGRDKENIPPLDDASQPNSRRVSAASRASDDSEFAKERRALGDLNVEDYYAAGCDPSCVFIVPADEEEIVPEVTDDVEQMAAPQPSDPTYALEPEDIPLPDSEPDSRTVDELMSMPDSVSVDAAVLERLEGTGETFDLWESGSAQDDTEEIQ